MAGVLRADFRREAEPSPYEATVARAVLVAHQEFRRGRARPSEATIEEAAAIIAGGGRPTAEHLFACLAASGFPIHHLVDLWADESTRIVARRLLLLLTGHG